jgi:hypothetical protein
MDLTCLSENLVPTYKLKIVTFQQTVIIKSLSLYNSATKINIHMAIKY